MRLYLSRDRDFSLKRRKEGQDLDWLILLLGFGFVLSFKFRDSGRAYCPSPGLDAAVSIKCCLEIESFRLFRIIGALGYGL